MKTLTKQEQDFKDYLEVLFDLEDIIEFRLIERKSKKVDSIWTAVKSAISFETASAHKFVNGTLKEGQGTIYEHLTTYNQKGFDIYVGINPRKTIGGKEDKDTADKYTKVYADLDGQEANDKFLESLGNQTIPTPSFVTNSGHGYRPYWILKDTITADDFRTFQRLIASKLSGDSSVCNPSRIDRIPGFINHKEPKANAFIYIPYSGIKYYYTTLLEHFELIEITDEIKQDTKQDTKSKNPDGRKIGEWIYKNPIIEGTRHKTLLSIACHYRQKKLSVAEVKDIILNVVSPYLVDYTLTEEEATYYATETDRYNFETTSFPLTDLGNAERFLYYYSDLFKYDYNQDTLYFYDGKKWNSSIAKSKVVLYAGLNARGIREQDAQKETTEDRKEKLIKHSLSSESKMRLDNSFKLAIQKEPIATESKEFNQDKYLLNVLNGTIDLTTGQLKEHNPKDLITQIANVEYDSTATCPLWESSLLKYMCNDKSLVDYLQRYFGYCLTGDIKERMIIIFNGDGKNGKSTILDTIHNILGDYSQILPRDFLVVKKNNVSGMEKKRDTILLKSKRFSYISETEKNDKLDTALIKEHTGQDTISGRDMRKLTECFCPTHKLAINTQYLPQVEENSSGVWDRLHVVDFKYRIQKEEEIKGFLRLFDKEKSGILNWLLQGCLEYQKQGLNPPESVLFSTSRYREESNPIADFIIERCEVEFETVEERKQKTRFQFKTNVSAKNLYYEYKQYTDSYINDREFGNLIKDLGFPKNRKNGGMFYYGIKLKESANIELDNIDSELNKFCA